VNTENIQEDLHCSKEMADGFEKLQRKHSYLWWTLAELAYTGKYELRAYHHGRELWSTRGSEKLIMMHINDLLS